MSMVEMIITRLFLLQLLVICCFSIDSSIKIRANREVFEFFNKAGHQVIDAEVPKIPIPNITVPIKGGPGTGQVTAANLIIKKFKSPKFAFELTDNGLFWKSRGGAVKIGGDWFAEYFLLLPLYEDGWVEVLATEIEIKLGANIYSLDKRPQIKITSCSAYFEHLDISIGGGVLPWLVNLFRADISEAVRQLINKQACTIADEILLIEANKFLHTLPLHIDIGKNFYVDYSLDQNPIYNPNFVEVNLSADVVYGQLRCIPQRTGNWTDVGPHERMVTVWVSQSIPHCLLQSVHSGNLVHFAITKDFEQFANYLKTSCSFLSPCIGRFFPQLSTQYPDQYVDLNFKTFVAPSIKFVNQTAMANFTFSVDIHVNPIQKNPKPLARLVLTAVSTVIPEIRGNRLIGTLNSTELTARQDFSTIGEMPQLFLNMFNKIFSLTARVLVQTILQSGVPIPVYDNVTISNNSEINIFNEYIRLSIDFESQEPTFTLSRKV